MTLSMLATRELVQETVQETVRATAQATARDIVRRAGSASSREAATYRAFYLDAKRKVRSARILRAANDSDAHTIARTLPNGFGIELWERARFLATFPPRAGMMQDAG